ncbi:hypothetical protein IWW38_006489, partial [Coemansia aciculifera]
AYGYLLNETGRAVRPQSLDALLASVGSVPQPRIVALRPPPPPTEMLSPPTPAESFSPPLSVRSDAQDSCVVPPTPAPPAFQFGPLPPLPIPPPSSSSSPTSSDGAFSFAPQITQCGPRIRDTLVDNALGVSLPSDTYASSSSPLPSTSASPNQQQQLHDKRESSQSESETIVFSPRADQCESTTTSTTSDDDIALEYPCTRSATPVLKLPTLPAIHRL